MWFSNVFILTGAEKELRRHR